MELKLVRTEINETPKSITLKEIEDNIKKSGQKIYYFDKENTHKNLISLVEFFEKKGFSVYQRPVKYGLSEEEYMYEVHIL